MTLEMRPATKDDAAFAAPLLAETNGAFGVEVIGLGKPELQLMALNEWFTDRGNRFSYQCSTVAELDGKTAGLLLAFSGADLTHLQNGCASRVFAIYGLFGALKMIWLNSSLAGNKEAEDDEYLIAHLAVAERFRYQGVAQALLAKAGQDTLSLGLHKLVLEVEIDNHIAISLYHKAGFELINTVYFNQNADRLKSPGFYKMIKTL